MNKYTESACMESTR